LELNIKIDEDICLPTRANPTDGGLDLVAKEYTVLKHGIRTLVHTGVYTEIPAGYVGLLIPRSSLSKYGVTMTNSIGVIDSDYRGEILASLEYTYKAGAELSYLIQKGQKIVQLVIVPILLPTIRLVSDLSDTARGAGGFGSTGK
jgi:dUTP pyrophosphatase